MASQSGNRACIACGLTQDEVAVANKPGIFNYGPIRVDPCTDGAVGCGASRDGKGCLYAKLREGGSIENDQTIFNDVVPLDQFTAPGGGLRVKFNPNEVGGPSSELFGDCLQTDFDGRLTVKIDPTPESCNAIQCNRNFGGGEGLYAPCEQAIHDIDQCFVDGLPRTVSTTSSENGITQIEGNKEWFYCNPGCCTVQGRLIIEAGGFAIDMGPDFYAVLTISFSRDGGTTWDGAFPEHFEWFDNRGNTNNKMKSVPVFHESQLNDQGPGACEQYIPGFEIQVFSGSGVFSNFSALAGFEFHRDMTAVGCNVCRDISASDISTDPSGHNRAKSLSFELR